MTITFAGWVWTWVLSMLLVVVVGLDGVVRGVKRARRRRSSWRQFR